MKKETVFAKDLAKKIVFDINNEYVVDCTPAQCIDIVEKAKEVGISIYENTERYPFDRKYPYLVWDGTDICQSSDPRGYQIVDFKTFMSALSSYKNKNVFLNENYTATVNENEVEVGCQSFPIDVIKKIIETHEYLYGKAK